MFHFKTLGLCALAMFALVACDKDEPTPTPPAPTAKTFQEIDASSYSDWTYVNLETGETQTLRDFTAWFYVDSQSKERVVLPAQGSASDIRIQWHIALRRELIKTNEGSAATTGSTDFESATLPAGASFVADAVETKRPLMVDFAAMMQGRPTYSVEDKRNPLLTTWITKSGTMPNIVYTPSKEVFVLRTKDNKAFKLQLTDFLNAKGDRKGFVSFKAQPYMQGR